MGRPSIYSPELAATICKEIALGNTLLKLSKRADMPNMDTVYEWRRTRADFSEMLEKARCDRADHRVERIDQWADQTRTGKLKPEVARLVIQAEQWQAAREQPRKYGDRLLHGSDPSAPLPAPAVPVEDKRAQLVNLVVNILDGRAGAGAAPPVTIEVAARHPESPPSLIPEPPVAKANGQAKANGNGHAITFSGGKPYKNGNGH